LIKLLFFIFVLASASFAQSNEDLLEFENRTNEKTKRPNEIKIVSYNIRWRGGDDLKKLVEYFKNDKEIGGASIIGLQEVDRNKKRTNNENTIKCLSHQLNMNYAWAAPPTNKKEKEEETGVAILSFFPLSDVTRIILPNEGPGGRRRVAIGATVQVGDFKIRFYSIHGETRIKSDEKLEQCKAVINDLNTYHKGINHAVILGDLNTIFPGEVENTSNLFINNHFNTPFPNGEKTWTQFFIKLKLDWIWLRGFSAKEYGIKNQIKLSDHFPLWLKVDLTNIGDANNRERVVPQKETPKKNR